MNPKGLKTSIVLNLLFILAVAMLLVDLVMVGLSRQAMLKVRFETANALLALSGPLLINGQGDAARSPAAIAAALHAASASCLIGLTVDGEYLATVGADCDEIEPLSKVARETIRSGRALSSFDGLTRGVFWPDRKTMLVSSPLYDNQEVTGAIAVALDLEAVYLSLRYSQRVFFVYFLVNLLTFSLLGLYLLYRSLLRPIKRLVNTAEKYRDDEDITFLPETRAGEFKRLSDTLNKMFARINRDRERLQKTIVKLEEANLKLRKTQIEMVRAEKLASVGRLSAGIAHEIGNPIGIVIGYLDLLKKASIPVAQKKDFILRAEREVNRINTIIRQLLEFARQPSEEKQHEISIHAVIDEVVEICAVQPMMGNITIVVDAAAAEDYILGTSDQLKQVFLNLLINAADAINSMADLNREGIIAIKTVNLQNDRAKHENGSIQIQVIDNGPGIETAILDDIFDPFYTTKEPGKGTGLGLSICFSIIESMAGDIKATSGGSGTIITVRLPLANRSMGLEGETPSP